MSALRRIPQEYVEYLLCRFVREAEEVQGRIRMQKVVFLVGEGDCPLFNDYFYHLRGPYSPALARTLGRLVDNGLLDEQTEDLGAERVQYHYKLSDRGGQVLERFERHQFLRGAVDLGNRYVPRFLGLASHRVRELELAATLAYWKKQGYSWKEAADITAELKAATQGSDELVSAKQLATEACAGSGG